MAASSARALGAQVWLERDASVDRVGELLGRAREIGLSQVRLFLLWPWIEAERGSYDFTLWDIAFDRAHELGLQVKATLTANSGPWWLGTGGVLHSHTPLLDEDHYPAIRDYVAACVTRYRDHPALGQWVLWNEPFLLPGVPSSNGDPARHAWRSVLAERYGEVEVLNRAWLTGYSSFAEVPPLPQLHHRAHDGMPWRGFDPILDDCDARARTLISNLTLIGEEVRAHDPQTPVCINPNLTLLNHAEAGYDLPRLAETVDVLGATFHASWTFLFAHRRDHLPLMLAGVSLLATTPGAAAAEVTEFQLGNAYYACNRPMGVTAAQIAAGFLFPILDGAQSVTGWDLNTRRHGYEAGEWSLLDARDRLTPRALAAQRVASALKQLDGELGHWAPPPVQAWVVVSARSQAIQYAHAELQRQDDAGRGRNEAIQGSALITARLRTMGVRAALVCAEVLTERPAPKVILVSHMSAWSADFAARLLELARTGSTVLLDGTCGTYTRDGTLHDPWPGGMEAVGLVSGGLSSRPDGPLDWPLRLFGADAGVLPLAHAVTDLNADAQWTAQPALRLGETQLPVMWTRAYGAGRLVYVIGALAPTVLREESAPAVEYVLTQLCSGIDRPCRPAGTATTVVSVGGAHGRAYALWTDPGVTGRATSRVSLPPGRYRDLWNETDIQHAGGELTLASDDGIHLLLNHSVPPATPSA